mmetsp:Transcript_18454/g.51682  ORF Transcript_18454/g.51682 Transcript_18454/m.51682 type:complete len:502 (+) Transcript_18454:208-1713(+)|eukprot:CAMPEP_0117658186 /NCGR_PEP_ID=MMETSP0804-20121206/5730_1 /TAXON_ID=1074897 /ORGANISM="Tetraselmis astigmatica, Strain CCMP880" /LENGTH=501 /DNA_ID=CAMNT_0005464691 /DNA_START=182 /DNA_END=1687 /DNA_ORIENTATION=-
MEMTAASAPRGKRPRAGNSGKVTKKAKRPPWEALAAGLSQGTSPGHNVNLHRLLPALLAEQEKLKSAQVISSGSDNNTLRALIRLGKCCLSKEQWHKVLQEATLKHPCLASIVNLPRNSSATGQRQSRVSEEPQCVLNKLRVGEATTVLGILFGENLLPLITALKVGRSRNGEALILAVLLTIHWRRPDGKEVTLLEAMHCFCTPRNQDTVATKFFLEHNAGLAWPPGFPANTTVPDHEEDVQQSPQTAKAQDGGQLAGHPQGAADKPANAPAVTSVPDAATKVELPCIKKEPKEPCNYFLLLKEGLRGTQELPPNIFFPGNMSADAIGFANSWCLLADGGLLPPKDKDLPDTKPSLEAMAHPYNAKPPPFKAEDLPYLKDMTGSSLPCAFLEGKAPSEEIKALHPINVPIHPMAYQTDPNFDDHSHVLHDNMGLHPMEGDTSVSSPVAGPPAAADCQALFSPTWDEIEDEMWMPHSLNWTCDPDFDAFSNSMNAWLGRCV